MTDFPLIRKLQNPDEDNKTPLPRGLKYKQFEVLVDSEKVIYNIPAREAERFETFLESADATSKYNLMQMIREVRGIRG